MTGLRKATPLMGITRGAVMTEPGGEPVLPSNNPRIRIGISNAAFYVSELRSGDGPKWCGGNVRPADLPANEARLGTAL